MIGVPDPKAVVGALPQELLDKRAEQVSPAEYALLADIIWKVTGHGAQGVQG